MALVFVVVLGGSSPALAEDRDVDTTVETPSDAVRVTVIRSGGVDRVQSADGGSGAQAGCALSLVYDPDLEDTPYGTSAGPMPSPDARFALLMCDAVIVRAVWVEPSDVIDLDAAARAEADRYVRDVLVPTVTMGANPRGRGLVGLSSWFWVDGFAGSLTPPPIVAFGLSIEVRLRAGSVTWDFGDGTVVTGDMGRAYPAESSMQHVHQHSGRYRVTAEVAVLAEYRVDGGPWISLPPLQATASGMREVEERQAVVTRS